MGRTPPFFLLKAVTAAPKRTRRPKWGTFPARIQFTRRVSENTKSPLALQSLADRVSFKCWGRRSDKPPEDPALKDSTAERTSRTSTWRGGTSERGNVLRSFGRSGCFSRSFPRVTSSKGAIVSELLPKRTAPLTSPSSTFVETGSDRRAFSFLSLRQRLCVVSQGVARDNKSEDDWKARHCLFVRDAKDFF